MYMGELLAACAQPGDLHQRSDCYQTSYTIEDYGGESEGWRRGHTFKRNPPGASCGHDERRRRSPPPVPLAPASLSHWARPLNWAMACLHSLVNTRSTLSNSTTPVSLFQKIYLHLDQAGKMSRKNVFIFSDKIDLFRIFSYNISSSKHMIYIIFVVVFSWQNI